MVRYQCDGAGHRKEAGRTNTSFSFHSALKRPQRSTEYTKNSGKHAQFPLQDIYSKLHVQPEADRLVTGDQRTGARDIILVEMYIAQIESERLQGKFYLPRHQVQVVNIGR